MKPGTKLNETKEEKQAWLSGFWAGFYSGALLVILGAAAAFAIAGYLTEMKMVTYF